METKKLTLGEVPLEGVQCLTPYSNILLIRSPKGLLACGYFDIEIANKLGESLVVVTGVQSYEDMYNAPVARLSEPARKQGVCEGMSGREALLLMS